MTATEPTPTAEHIDAVALMLADLDHYRRGNTLPVGTLGAVYRERAVRVLTSTDPAVHAALLDALVRAGVLTEELGVLALRPDGERWLAARFRTRGAAEAYCHLGAGLAVAHRHVTPWEVAP